MVDHDLPSGRVSAVKVAHWFSVATAVLARMAGVGVMSPGSASPVCTCALRNL